LTPLAPHPPLRDFYGDAARRERYVRNLFDDTAPWYDIAIGFLSFGSGGWYRRDVLARAGLKRGDRLLDLATGTGVIARAASSITTEIVGADPSIGMLKAGRDALLRVQATSEALPFDDASFDFITIGFAMRHFADLDVVFRECRRVLRPGGRILILEITAPESRLARGLLGAYMGAVVPAVITAVTLRPRVGKLMSYYWATTRDCVRPDAILAALQGAGFDGAKREVSLAIFSEYSARLLPASPATGRSESAETREATSPDRRESR
jgi:demethylmenaquinone methyltransferase / 2-methoxy-6-polyprenyl-1,4-benzoquinol methylase